MNTHEAGRGKAAWRERNEGAEAPGDGQNVLRYIEPEYPFGGPQPGTQGLPVEDDHADTSIPAEAEVDPSVDWPPVTAGGGTAQPPESDPNLATKEATPSGTIPATPATPGNQPATGLTTKNSPGLLGRP